MLAYRNLMVGAFNASRSRCVRAVEDGDSQETSPGGSGSIYAPSLNYGLYRRYGNVPETQIMSCGSYTGAWAQRAAVYGAIGAGTASTTIFPYSLQPGSNNVFDDAPSGFPVYGDATMLQANMIDLPAGLTQIGRTNEYIRRSGVSFHFMLPALTTQATSVSYRCVNSAINSVSYVGGNATQTATGTVDTSSAVGSTTKFVEFSIAYDYGATSPTSANLASLYPQVILRSTNASPTVETGPRWFMSSNTSGITVHSLSAGGKKTSDLQADRPDCMPFMQAFTPDIVMLSCGTNETGGAGTSGADFKAAVLSKIAFYQTVAPTAIFLLFSEVDRTSSVPNRSEWDAYADRLAEVAADSANNAIQMNMRRRMEVLYDWRAASPTITTYLSDGVHYTTAGGIAVGTEKAKLMLEAAGLSSGRISRATQRTNNRLFRV